MTSKPKPDWAIAAEKAIRERAERTPPLPPEIQASELLGMRVIVVRNEKTGEVAPTRIVHGSDFTDYYAFMAAVRQAIQEIREETGGGDWVVEDAWARSIEEFLRNYPELSPSVLL